MELSSKLKIKLLVDNGKKANIVNFCKEHASALGISYHTLYKIVQGNHAPKSEKTKKALEFIKKYVGPSDEYNTAS